MKNNVMQEFLKQFTIFKNLSPSEMEPIIDIANSRKYKPGKIVFMQHEPITDVFFIQSGKVKIYKTDYDGREQLFRVLQQDDMFPHQGFFRKGNYPAHAEIMEETVLVNIPILSFENFLLTNPQICIKMFEVLGEIIVDLQNRLEEKILYSVYDQIVLLLLRLARDNGELMADNIYRLSISLTNGELANMIGSSRETVSRTLTKLKNQELISQDIHGFLMIYYDQLEASIFT
ncbi:MAG TPA: Crp/Fnr family transcriptional regulator [Pseudogracilibacillus sp.]|nr:Crp/Fnr family transcriptional regulator [Pseudogracilibacillus sp.]